MLPISRIHQHVLGAPRMNSPVARCIRDPSKLDRRQTVHPRKAFRYPKFLPHRLGCLAPMKEMRPKKKLSKVSRLQTSLPCKASMARYRRDGFRRRFPTGHKAAMVERYSSRLLQPMSSPMRSVHRCLLFRLPLHFLPEWSIESRLQGWLHQTFDGNMPPVVRQPFRLGLRSHEVINRSSIRLKCRRQHPAHRSLLKRLHLKLNRHHSLPLQLF